MPPAKPTSAKSTKSAGKTPGAGAGGGAAAEMAAALLEVAFVDTTLEAAATEGEALVAFFAPGADAPAADGAEPKPATLLPAAASLDVATGGQVARALEGASGEAGEAVVLLVPHGLGVRRLLLIGLGQPRLDDALAARRIGAAIAAALKGSKAASAHLRLEGVAGGALTASEAAAEIGFGLALRAYRFERHKSKPERGALERVELGGVAAAAAAAAYAPREALAAGVVTARDLVNEPANVLTPETFAARIGALEAEGLEVEILGEARLEEIGMRALLAVGRGSRRESHVAILRWAGAAGAGARPPLCFVGKGVCFDTGGVSLKPAAGMEEMTMDMGGAAVVVGAMRALARRKAAVDVIGVVGLVENMPDGDAQRPGDIVTSLSGQTVEVINTDAEGRLVLADLLTYVQDRYAPRAIVDLATLTGAMVIALGHETAGVFANDDAFAEALLGAAEQEGEAAWRLPLGKVYDKQLRSRLADMKNVGGRPAGAITAAQFLQRFVKPGQAWAHIDIAGVALTKEDGPFWSKGASGWGVATLVRLAEAGEA